MDNNIRKLERKAAESLAYEDVAAYWRACLKADMLPVATVTDEHYHRWVLEKPFVGATKDLGDLEDEKEPIRICIRVHKTSDIATNTILFINNLHINHFPTLKLALLKALEMSGEF